MDCLLIADDLTGACDAAVHFALRGLPVSVFLERDDPPPNAGVVAVNTESRCLPESEIPAIMARTANWLPAAMVFKKIDSTLRGNPAAEIAAVMQAFACDAAIVTPAFPAMGRTVESGRLNIGDLDVARLLRSEAHVPCTHVAAALRAGTRVVSADAVCDADLDRIVAAGLATGRRILWSGSAGLASSLAKHCGAPSPPASPPRAPVTFCIGSDHAVTLQQVAVLRQHRPDCQIVPLDQVPSAPQALLLSGGDTATAVCRAAGARRIDLRGEVLPGIPWGILRSGRLDGIPVITKSGGFGAPDALIRIAEFFQ